MATTPTLAVPSSTLAALTAKPPAGDGNASAEMETTGTASFAAHFQLIIAKQADIYSPALPLGKTAQGDERAGHGLTAQMPDASPLATQATLTAKPPSGNGHALANWERSGAASFAHFQRIAAKRVGIDPAAILPEKPEQGDDSASGDSLTALPAIFDMLGLAQRQAVADSLSTDTDIQPRTATPEAAATVLAAPVTPAAAAAISAGAISADAPRSPAAAPPPLSSEAAVPTFAADTEPAVSAKPDAGIVSPAGREFASHLTSAITATHEPQSPGATAAAVQQVITNLSPAHAVNDHRSLNIATPVGAPGWSDEVGNRIAWIASQGRSQAELVLNPPQMGRIEVNLTLNGDQAAASFASSNPVVRELLEAALPRLREVLADAGIQLGQAQVGAEHARQQAQQEKHEGNPASDLNGMPSANTAISAVSSGSLSTHTVLKSGRGLVDVFA